jgi:hypothetical protein
VSQIVWALLLHILSATHGTAQPQCARSGAAAWSPELIEILPDCDLVAVSPDRRISVHVDKTGQLTASVRDSGPLETGRLTVIGPGTLSWSPDSKAFFINDGEGSGMSSKFRLFRIEDGRLREDQQINSSLIDRFRSEKKCHASIKDQSVTGFGWSKDGKQIYLFVQDGPHYPCAAPGSFICWVIRTDSGLVVERVSEKGARRRFGSLLPKELFQK